MPITWCVAFFIIIMWQYLIKTKIKQRKREFWMSLLVTKIVYKLITCPVPFGFWSRMTVRKRRHPQFHNSCSNKLRPQGVIFTQSSWTPHRLLGMGGASKLPAKTKSGRIKGADSPSSSSRTAWQDRETRLFGLRVDVSSSITAANTDPRTRTESTSSACSWKPGDFSLLLSAARQRWSG